jgi:hypothetical protein
VRLLAAGLICCQEFGGVAVQRKVFQTNASGSHDFNDKSRPSYAR